MKQNTFTFMLRSILALILLTAMLLTFSKGSTARLDLIAARGHLKHLNRQQIITVRELRVLAGNAGRYKSDASRSEFRETCKTLLNSLYAGHKRLSTGHARKDITIPVSSPLSRIYHDGPKLDAELREFYAVGQALVDSSQSGPLTSKEPSVREIKTRAPLLVAALEQAAIQYVHEYEASIDVVRSYQKKFVPIFLLAVLALGAFLFYPLLKKIQVLSALPKKGKGPAAVIPGERYRMLIEQMPATSYIVELGLRNQTVYVSPQVETMLGYTQDEWLADPKLWRSIIHPDDSDRIADEVVAKNLTGEAFTLEYRTYTKSGQLIWVRNQATYLCDKDGEPHFTHGVIVNITDQVQSQDREKQLQQRLVRGKRMESMVHMAGGVAHDLNNILGPVVAYPDLILKEIEEDDPIRADLLEIRDSAKNAAAVIRDLLALARSGNIQVEPVFVNKAINAYFCSASGRRLAKDNPDVIIDQQLHDPLPPISGLLAKLSQVLMNLVTNGYEAMPHGGNLTVFTEHIELSERKIGFETIEPGEYIKLSIKDTGSGIRPEDLEKIFEPFYTRKKMGRSGTGLGLTVVYGTVKDLGGFIDVRSQLGESTLFDLYLPVMKDIPLAELPEPEIRGSGRVLIVDDAPVQRDVASRLLRYIGYETGEAANGHEALKELEAQSYDMVILDMIMEDDFDGLDTYKKIIEINPDQPCIIVTGYSENARVKEALALGARACLRKPYTIDLLNQTLARELNGTKPTVE